MDIYIDGVRLPHPSGYKETETPNDTTNQGLSGNLNTRFLNVMRSWVISWSLMKLSDYETIERLYLKQYQTNTYLMMQFDKVGFYGPVKIEFSPQKIKYNGGLVGAFSITLKEKYPIS